MKWKELLFNSNFILKSQFVILLFVSITECKDFPNQVWGFWPLWRWLSKYSLGICYDLIGEIICMDLCLGFDFLLILNIWKALWAVIIWKEVEKVFFPLDLHLVSPFHEALLKFILVLCYYVDDFPFLGSQSCYLFCYDRWYINSVICWRKHGEYWHLEPWSRLGILQRSLQV